MMCSSFGSSSGAVWVNATPLAAETSSSRKPFRLSASSALAFPAGAGVAYQKRLTTSGVASIATKSTASRTRRTVPRISVGLRA